PLVRMACRIRRSSISPGCKCLSANITAGRFRGAGKVLRFPGIGMSTRRCLGAFLTTVLVSAGAFAAEPDATLLRAAERGDQALARALLQQGTDVNAPGVDGSTPLHRAVFTDHFDVASLLVKAGAKVGTA